MGHDPTLRDMPVFDIHLDDKYGQSNLIDIPAVESTGVAPTGN
jgi:hypothetical protein